MAFFDQLKPISARWAVMINAAVLTLVVTVVVVKLANPSMAVLFSRLDEIDTTKITTELDHLQINYEVEESSRFGRTDFKISVPANKIRKLRTKFREVGISSYSSQMKQMLDGFERRSGADSNRRKRLEREIEEVILSLSEVRSVTVSLSMGTGVRYNLPPIIGARVKIESRESRFSSSTVRRVEGFVRAGVGNLSPERIQIFDQENRRLNVESEPDW